MDPIDLDDIYEHPANATLFVDSFSEDCIRELAEDIEKHGLLQPPLLADIKHEDGRKRTTGVDGHRRLRAFKWLRDHRDAEKWGRLTDYRHLGIMTSDEALHRIIAAYGTTRQPSPREQFNVFKASRELLQRERGRPVGRPSKDEDKNNLSPNYLDAEAIRLEAAKEAKISQDRAKKLEAIFDRGDEKLQESVARGETSVSAAYEQVPKRAKTTQRKMAAKRASIVSVAPPEGELAIRAVQKMVDHIEKTGDAESKVKALAFHYDYLEVESDISIAPLVAKFEEPGDAGFRDDIVRGLMLHYGVAKAKNPSTKTELSSSKREETHTGTGSEEGRRDEGAAERPPVTRRTPPREDEGDELVAKRLLRGITVERAVELLLLAIRESEQTNAIMKGVCLGLGMAWDDDDRSTEGQGSAPRLASRKG